MNYIISSSNEFEIMRSDLAFKEGELEKSKFTEQGLQSENLNLQANLQKVSHLLHSCICSEVCSLESSQGGCHDRSLYLHYPCTSFKHIIALSFSHSFPLSYVVTISLCFRDGLALSIAASSSLLHVSLLSLHLSTNLLCNYVATEL